MLKFERESVGVLQGSELLFSDFDRGGDMWTATGPREVVRAVTFKKAFRGRPAVHAGLSMWDTDAETNQRMDLQLRAITKSGFEIVFKTWSDSRIARVRAGWIAIGPVAFEDDWDLGD